MNKSVNETKYTPITKSAIYYFKNLLLLDACEILISKS